MRNDRWELGSEFHLALPSGVGWMGSEAAPWDSHEASLYTCGRDALAAVLKHGRDTHGWRRVWIPDYTCQEVVASAAAVLNPHYYRALPNEPFVGPWDDCELNAMDVVIVTNSFGLRARVALDQYRTYSIIEDHTHDPFSHWASSSVADYAIASLRKVLPIPDGGVLWSPLERPLPERPQSSEIRIQAVTTKSLGMALKTLYLAGGRVDKKAFLELNRIGESLISCGEVSQISDLSQALISIAPWRSWRGQRRSNFESFSNGISGVSALTLFQAESSESLPFSCFLEFATNQDRNSAREALISAHIYPAILWPLELPVDPGISGDAVSLSRRSLSVHCDHRYSGMDMERAVEVLASWAGQRK